MFSHGYIILDWLLPIFDLNTQVALAITVTGTSKTSGVSIAALTYCDLFPGFHFLNAAPTCKQAELMLEEMTNLSGSGGGLTFVINAVQFFNQYIIGTRV